MSKLPSTRRFRHPFVRISFTVLTAAPLAVLSAAPARAAVHTAPAAVTISQHVAVPGYINPLADPEAWARLAAASPVNIGLVVANVLNGPDYVPSADWAAVIHSVHARGIRVVGYVDTGYLGTTGQRTRLGSVAMIDWISQIEHDVSKWYEFYGADLDGIFFDQAQNACGPTPESNEWADAYRSLDREVKRLHAGATTVANPGIGVPECYASAADVIVTFEGSFASYTGDPAATNPYAPLAWDPVDPNKIWHIVYGAPDVDAMTRAVALSKQRDAGYLYVTDDVLANPYDELPTVGYFDSEGAQAAAIPDGELIPPSAPATLDTVEVYGTRIDLDWERSEAGSAPVVAYDVYRDGVWIDSVPATRATYSALDLTPLTNYTFTVVARDAYEVTSAPSNDMMARADETYGDPLRPPDQVTASDTTYTGTRLAWAPVSRWRHWHRPDVEFYVVTQNGRPILQLPWSTTAVTVGSLAPGATYSFGVYAIDSTGDRTADSAPVVVTTPELPSGQTIGAHSVTATGDTLTFSAEYLLPYAFRRVFIDTSTVTPCWSLVTDQPVCAGYLIENERLYHYAGTGSTWDWSIVSDVVPTIAGSMYTWTIAATDIGAPASMATVFNASGYAPDAYCGPGDSCFVSGPPIPYE